MNIANMLTLHVFIRLNFYSSKFDAKNLTKLKLENILWNNFTTQLQFS